MVDHESRAMVLLGLGAPGAGDDPRGEAAEPCPAEDDPIGAGGELAGGGAGTQPTRNNTTQRFTNGSYNATPQPLNPERLEAEGLRTEPHPPSQADIK